MQLEILGSGTSHGIPVIACDCETCKSQNQKDKRLRCSALVTDKSSNIETPTDNGIAHSSEQSCGDRTTNILIDVGPEFRIQALRSNIKHLDAVLLTHSHADHLHGIDDLRVFSCTRCKQDHKQSDSAPLKIYANENTIRDFESRFDYLFKPIEQGGGRAFVELIDTANFSPENPLVIGGIKIVPVPMLHGKIKTSGYVFQKDGKTIVYLTDCNKIPGSSIELIKSFGKIDFLVIDGLRVKPHSTHFSFSEAMAEAEKIAATHTYLTHICHDTKHEDIIKWISESIATYPTLAAIVQDGGSVSPAFDGLVF